MFEGTYITPPWLDMRTCSRCQEAKPSSEFRNRRCLACIAAQRAAHYQANKPRIAARNKRWRAANRERVVETERLRRRRKTPPSVPKEQRDDQSANV